MSGRSQTIVAGACAALVLGAFLLLFVRPRRAELGRARQQVTEERDRSQQLGSELARLEALRDTAPRLEAALEEMRSLVPPTDEVADFMLKVQTAADQSGVGFVQVTPELPDQPPEGAPLAEVRATIGAGGGYFAVQDFIRRLYDLERAVRIDNLTITGTEDERQARIEGRTTVQLVARIFFELPEGTQPAAAATPGSAPATPSP